MKRLFAATFSGVLFCAALTVFAGGSSTGGGAQIAPTDSGSASTYKSTTSSIPGGNAYDSAGASASGGSAASTGGASSAGGFGGSSSGSSAAGGSASSSGAPASRDNGSSVSSSSHAGPAGNTAKELKNEKVTDTGDKHFEASSSNGNQSKDKTFSGGLLDNANDIAAVNKEKAPAAGDSRFETKPKPAADKDDSDKKK